jgi:hypothetical protein
MEPANDNRKLMNAYKRPSSFLRGREALEGMRLATAEEVRGMVGRPSAPLPGKKLDLLELVGGDHGTL